MLTRNRPSPRVFGVLAVRNAHDLVEVNIRHHLALGLERIFVTDNGSTDGTWEVLRRLARRLPVEIERDEKPFRQAEVVNRGARRAAAAGAEWVLPLDVDEFFTCERGLHVVLADTDAAALRCPVINFVQRREQTELDPRALLTMDTRPVHPLDPADAQPHVRAGRLGFVEAAKRPSVIAKSTPDMWITMGNHDVENAGGPVVDTGEIVCLHAALRARAAIAGRADHGRRLDEAGEPADSCWQLRGLPDDPEGIEAMWRANSNRGGYLHPGDTRRPLVRDTRLRDAVAPHVGGPLRRALVGPATRLRSALPEPRGHADLVALRERLEEQAGEITALRRQVEGTWEMADLRARIDATSEWIRLAEVPEDMLISVVTPTHNRPHGLLRAVSSVLDQSYANWEHVIVDDGSGPETAEVIRSIEDPRVRALRIEGEGSCVARNHAIDAARGEYVVYLDDDNAFHRDWLRSVAWAARVYGDDLFYGAILGEHAGADAPAEERERGPVVSQARFDRAELLRGNIIDGGQLAHRRDLAEARWDQEVEGACDWDLLLRLTRDRDPRALPVISLAYTRSSPDRMTDRLHPLSAEVRREMAERHRGELSA